MTNYTYHIFPIYIIYILNICIYIIYYIYIYIIAQKAKQQKAEDDAAAQGKLPPLRKLYYYELLNNCLQSLRRIAGFYCQTASQIWTIVKQFVVLYILYILYILLFL